MSERGRPVTFLLKRFPRLSETFILNELLALEGQGVPLRIYSILDPQESIVHADVARLRTPVEYFPGGWRGAWDVARSHAQVAVAAPGTYLRTLADATSRFRRTAIKHFVRAGWLAARLRESGTVHLHAHFAHGPASVAQFASRLAGVSFSFTAHAKDIYTSPPELLKAKLRAARFVVTCTDYNAQHLAHLAGEPWAERIHRIYHGVDFDRFGVSSGSVSSASADPEPASGSGSAGPGPVSGSRAVGASPAGRAERDPSDTGVPVCVSIGRLVEKKGFVYLIEAARILQADGRAVRFRIIGGGDQRAALEAEIERAGLRGVVEVGGAMPQEKLIAEYERAALFVLPCVVTENGDRDGIPNVLVEAMRMGVPVISTAISGIPELVIDGETGLLVPPRDPHALARAIERLLGDPVLAQSLAARAAQHVADRFDLHRNAERLRDLLSASVA
jgi:glycosyltransferase involved in cell wall biosynthesis